MAHTEITGAPGTGKSTLAKTLAIQQIKDGAAVVYFDVYGDDLIDLMAHVPASRIKDTVLFDPTDPQYLIEWNPLEKTDNVPLLATAIFDSIKGAWDMGINPPNIEVMVRSLIYASQQYNLSLYQCLFLLKDAAFTPDNIDNPVLRHFLTDYYSKSQKDKDNISWSTFNKLYSLLLDQQLQRLLRQKKTRFSMSLIKDTGLLFIKTPLAHFGTSTTTLLNSLLFSQLHLACLSRDTTKPMHIYIDGADRVASLVLTEGLSILGKQNVHLTLIHRTIGDVKPELFAAMRGNCEHKYVFKTSAEDSDVLIPNPINRGWRLDQLRYYEYRSLPWEPSLRELHTEPLPPPSAKRMVERITANTHWHYCKELL